jgi:hypothetical protein
VRALCERVGEPPHLPACVANATKPGLAGDKLTRQK